MSHFTLHISFPSGGPLIGGYSATMAGVHKSHAQHPSLNPRTPPRRGASEALEHRVDDRDNGQPVAYLPATAMRGALRMTLEAVLRGAGHSACARGSGIDPAAAGSAAAATPDATPTSLPHATPCTLGEAGAPCLPCRLFGTQADGLRPGAHAFSALVLGDASPASTVAWSMRPGVSVTRSSRSANENRLFMQRAPTGAAGRPLRFVAHGRLIDPTLKPNLEAAVRATTHIGAGQSRGFAHAVLDLDWHDAPTSSERDPAATSAAIPSAEDTSSDHRDLQIQVTLQTPALIGTAIVDQNFRESRAELPGSAVRGAIGFTLAELIANDGDGFDPARPDRDQAMQRLLAPASADDNQDGASFGFLFPINGALSSAPRRGTHGQSATIDGPIGALPITARACKHHGRSHGVIDTLLDRLVMRRAGDLTEAERVTRLIQTRCPICQAPLRGADGNRHAQSAPTMRTITRVALDRSSHTAKDAQLFAQLLLERGTVLAGTIRNIPSAGRARLGQALASGRLSFGRGRSMGWGQATVASTPAPQPEPLEQRGDAFMRALHTRLGDAQLPDTRTSHLLPITLLTPLWLPGGHTGALGDDADRIIADAVGASDYALKARRFTRDGAWDQRSGAMQPCWTIAAGAVFVVDLGQRDWRSIAADLEAMERVGVGERRHQGYGQVLCFDPFIWEHDTRAHPLTAATLRAADTTNPTSQADTTHERSRKPSKAKRSKKSRGSRR